jgi:hypothetical protein
MDWDLITMFINSGKVAGWVRAGVAAGFPILIAKYPPLGDYLDAATQAQIAAVLSTIAVGIWSHIAKVMAANQPKPNSPGLQPGGAIGR